MKTMDQKFKNWYQGEYRKYLDLKKNVRDFLIREAESIENNHNAWFEEIKLKPKEKIK